MNPKGIGEVSEAIVLAELLKLGKVVCLPFGNNQSYDLVVDDERGFTRVQVKTGRIGNGCVVFDTCSRNTITGARTAYAGRADEFMVYCPANSTIYRIPVQACGGNATSLRLEPPRGGATSRIRWAADYELVTVARSVAGPAA